MNDTIPFLGWAIKPIHLTAVYYAIWLFFGFFGTGFGIMAGWLHSRGNRQMDRYVESSCEISEPDRHGYRMGVARYGGRGAIFSRLATRKKRYPKELQYFSFYVIANKAHEREIETVILRAAGPQMTLNTNKVALGLHPGNIADYEPGTHFFERQNVRGRKAITRKKKNSN
jgi:hypothetical protein